MKKMKITINNKVNCPRENRTRRIYHNWRF